MRFDVVGLGMNCVDFLLRLPDIDSPVGERPILEWSTQGGGKVATAMAAVGRLGAKVAVITKVGNDEWGKFVIADFQKYGVDTSHVFFDESLRTLVVFILVDKHGGHQWVSVDAIRDWNLPESVRRAVREVGARREVRPSIWEDRIPYSPEQLDIVTEGRMLNLDGSPPDVALEAARTANGKGIQTCYDMYRHPNMPELLKNITYCIPSRRSAVEFTKETDPIAICRKLLSYGPEVAGVTLGDEGCIFATRNELIVRKAFRIQEMVDTLGAGDVFHGAFSFAVVQGWDLARVVEFASAVAALKCRKLGGRVGMPTMSEAEAFLREHVEEIR